MWPVPRAEGVDSSSLLSLQTVDVGLNDGVDLQRSGLSDHKPSVDLVLAQSPHKHPYVITGLSVVQCFVEGFDSDSLRLELFIIAVELYVIANLDPSLLHCTTGHCSSTRYVVGTLHCHQEGLVDGPPSNLDLLVHSIQQFLDSLLSQLRFGVLKVVQG